MVAIVTGAGSRAPGVGNGRAAAILFAREGARVLLVDSVAEWADQTLGMIADEHGEASVVEADVTRAQDCQRIVDEAVRRYGRIDILHNNVGIGGNGSVVDIDLEAWDQIMQVNVKSMMLMARHVIPVMAANGGGAITNVSSISSIRPRGLTPYTTSKGAVNALTIAMAVDHAAQGIRVNAILPGPVYTPGVASAGMTPEQRATRARSSLLGTEGTAWDVGWAAVYLASPEARWVTGQLLCVDGGVSLTSAARSVGDEPRR
ncbi:MAG: SDR family oxidoreductase [Chloroflexi bacterium]|nr:SDR family oxidoreductase [Chloroflexota bacterium]MBV9596303.1 SDR family oxidoreductase [Chloroflexota bacterium]